MNDDWEEMREEGSGHDGAAQQRAGDGLAAPGDATATGAGSTGGEEPPGAEDALPPAAAPPGSFPASARDGLGDSSSDALARERQPTGDGTRPPRETVALTPRTPLPPAPPRPATPWTRPGGRSEPRGGRAGSGGSGGSQSAASSFDQRGAGDDWAAAGTVRGGAWAVAAPVPLDPRAAAAMAGAARAVPARQRLRGAVPSRRARRRSHRGTAGIVTASLVLVLLLVDCVGFLLLRPLAQQPGMQLAGGQTLATPTYLAEQATATPTRSAGAQGGSGSATPPTSSPSPTASPSAAPGVSPTATATAPAPAATATATATVGPTDTPLPPPTATATATATATTAPPPPTATATATPVPPFTATVRFTPVSQSLRFTGTLSGCPGSCNFADTAVNRWQWFTHGVTFSRARQVALQGYVTLTDDGPSTYQCPTVTPCADIRWQGGPFWADCGTLSSLQLSAGQSTTIFCQVQTSTGSVAPGQFTGIQFTSKADLAWTNHNWFWWVAVESSADCNNDLSWLAYSYGRGQLLAYWNGVTAGQTIVHGPAIGGWTGWYCSPPPGSYTESFNDGVQGNVSGLAFRPSAVVAAAGVQRDALLPGGYVWYSREASCTVGSVQDLGNNRVSATCPLGGVAVWRWDASAQAQFAGALAGRSVSDAHAFCNGSAPYSASWPGIVGGTCTIDAAGATQLPTDPTKITIAAGAPAAARLDVRGAAVASSTALGVTVGLFAVVGGLFLGHRRQRRPSRGHTVTPSTNCAVTPCADSEPTTHTHHTVSAEQDPLCGRKDV